MDRCESLVQNHVPLIALKSGFGCGFGVAVGLGVGEGVGISVGSGVAKGVGITVRSGVGEGGGITGCKVAVAVEVSVFDDTGVSVVFSEQAVKRNMVMHNIRINAIFIDNSSFKESNVFTCVLSTQL